MSIAKQSSGTSLVIGFFYLQNTAEISDVQANANVLSDRPAAPIGNERASERPTE